MAASLAVRPPVMAIAGPPVILGMTPLEVRQPAVDDMRPCRVGMRGLASDEINLGLAPLTHEDFLLDLLDLNLLSMGKTGEILQAIPRAGRRIAETRRTHFQPGQASIRPQDATYRPQ